MAKMTTDLFSESPEELRIRADSHLQGVSDEEISVWLNHPCTRYLRLHMMQQIYEGLEQHMEGVDRVTRTQEYAFWHVHLMIRNIANDARIINGREEQ